MSENTKFMTYYRNWRDAEMYMVNTTITDPNPTRLTDLPYGIDIVTVFGGLPEDAGTGRYLVYDSNNPNSPVLNDTVKPYFNHIVYQQYGLGSSTTKTFITLNDDIKDKSIPGVTFPEELSSNKWYDIELPYTSSHAKDVADFVRDNELGGMFFYAVDRDGRTYAEDDFSHIKPTSFLWTKTAIAEVKNVTLSDAKTLAQTYLNENEDILQLSDEVVKTLTQAIRGVETLYDVNHVFLDDDYYASISPTFDLFSLSQSNK